jgi:hypothetical protein
VKHIEQMGTGPMQAGWAQDRVSPFAKPRLFIIWRDLYKSPLWKLNKRSLVSSTHTRTLCEEKTSAFPENQERQDGRPVWSFDDGASIPEGLMIGDLQTADTRPLL